MKDQTTPGELTDESNEQERKKRDEKLDSCKQNYADSGNEDNIRGTRERGRNRRH